MLTFRKTNIFFGILVLLLLILRFWFDIAVFIYILIVLFYFALLLYGSVFIASNFFIPVVCFGHTSRKQIAITFDDGPTEHYTPQILEILKDHQVSAAFFCIGKRIEDNELLFRRLHEQGHIIGNHSYSHTPFFDFLPSAKLQEDLQQADIAVKNVIGLQPKLFRPPYGITTPAMKKAIKDRGYTAIGWSIRSFDTIAKNEEKLLNKLVRLLKPGAVVLLHDTQKITLDMLPRFIQAARNEGYEFVRLDKLLNLKVYA
jgi:peptidoglycan/xylan/chitin deacetylase (PgdA/CDA1 family)